MTSFREKKTLIFGGDKQDYHSWKEQIILKWYEKGVSSIGKGKTLKPQDNGRSSRKKERKEWDKSNEMAKGILLAHLDEDFVREGKDTELNCTKCHDILRYLDREYGGANNRVQVAKYLLLTKQPLKEDQTMKKFIDKYLYNHKEARTDINDSEKMIADLTLLLGDSTRTKASLDHARVMKMNFKDTIKHLKDEDENYLMIKENKKFASSTGSSASSTGSSTSSSFIDPPPSNYDQVTPVVMYANRPNIANSNTANQMKKCWYFADHGKCMHGDNCQFKHDNGATNSSNKGCKICKKTDHWASDCPTKTSMSSEACSLCQRNGHWARDCPERNVGDTRSRSPSQSRGRDINKRARSSSPYNNQRYSPTSALKTTSSFRPGTPAPK
jgi:hypothetical protein